MLDFLIGNDLLSAILAFIIVLIPAVIVHEIGHFLAARATGITVLEFGIGFPPRIAKLFTWRETEFTLNAIPLGGFVRPLGEDMIRPLSEAETEEERQRLLESAKSDLHFGERAELEARGFKEIRAVHEVKPLPRMFFMFSGSLANFILAFVVFVIIGLVGLPDEVGIRLGILGLMEESPLAGIQEQDFIERINGEYFQSPEEMVNLLAQSIGETAAIEIRRFSPSEVLMVDLEVTQEVVDFVQSVEPSVQITDVVEGSPAETAGLRMDDVIVAFNGEPLTTNENPAQSLVEMTNAAAGNEVRLTIARDGELTQILVVPRENPPIGQGRIGIGISPVFTNNVQTLSYIQGTQFEAVPQPLNVSVNYAWGRIGAIFNMIASFPARLMEGSAEPEERRVVSVVGISQLGGAILQDSIEEDQATPLLEYVALISIALGFTNLLPIPALDGGRIMFVLVELVRGKPIPPEREGIVHLLGVVFILSIGVFFIINDLMNPLTDLIR